MKYIEDNCFVGEVIEQSAEIKLLENLSTLIDTMKWTAYQAIDALRVPESDRGRYAEKLKAK